MICFIAFFILPKTQKRFFSLTTWPVVVSIACVRITGEHQFTTTFLCMNLNNNSIYPLASNDPVKVSVGNAIGNSAWANFCMANAVLTLKSFD